MSWQEDVQAAGDLFDSWANQQLSNLVLTPAINAIGGALSLIQNAAELLGATTIAEYVADAIARLDALATEHDLGLREQYKTSIMSVLRAALDEADFPLDQDEPFSAESLTFAVNHKLGTAFSDITDRDAVEYDLKNIAADKVNEVLDEQVFENGEALTDVAVWREFVMGRAADYVNETFGIDVFSDLTDPKGWGELIEQQLMAAARGEAAFLGEYGCAALNTVLEAFCKVEKCHSCMPDYQDCLDRRARDKKHRDNHDRDCKWSRKGVKGKK